jgi:hypothetical protein
MFFAGHGGKSVFASHFMHLGRAVTPFLAGSSRMPYLRFFVFNTLGCALWAATFGLLGYFFGESWHVVEKWFGRASATLVGLLLFFRFHMALALARNETGIKQTGRAVLDHTTRCTLRRWFARGESPSTAPTFAARLPRSAPHDWTTCHRHVVALWRRPWAVISPSRS